MYNKNKFQEAFTLVELSIVIVIIALIISGTSAAKRIVEQSQIRTTITDINRIVTAINNFKLQYNKYPGDINNFSSYYSSCVNYTSNPCDGNGDGYIDSLTSNSSFRENLRVYQHLTLSKLFPGNFDGQASTGTTYGIASNNTPFSPLNGGNIVSYAFWRQSSGESIRLTVGRPRPTADANKDKPYDAALTAVQAKEIDTKIDDGIPDIGVITSVTGTGNLHNCVNGTPNIYLVQYSSELNCRIRYIIRN